MYRPLRFFREAGSDFRAQRLSKKRRTLSPPHRRRLAFEPLEDRSLLSVCVWNGGSTADSNWMTPENWVGNATPQPGDQLQFSGTARITTNNDFPAGTSFQSIDFAAGGFVVAGHDVTLTGGIDVASGVTGSTISLNVALAGSLTVDVTDTTLSISGSLSGSNYLTKTGTGTLILSGDNTYTGGTVIGDGTLSVGSDAALVQCGNGLLVNGDDAVLDLNGHNVTVGAVGLINGSIHSTTAASITATSYVVLNGAIDVDLHGTDAPLMKATSGAVTLSGANDYTGPTTIYGGTLQLDGPDAWNPAFDNVVGTDIQDGKLVLDYSASPSSDPASGVLSDLTASHAATPAFSTGQIHSSTAAFTSTAIGWTDTATSQQVTIARVRYGDANLDGSVNASDFTSLLGNFAGTGKTWSQGDFNYDGTVNACDLSVMLGNYCQSPTPLPPQVAEIARLGAAETDSSSVQFAVVFSKDVSGVDASDFQLQCLGTSGTITLVAACSPSSAVYLVTVDNVLGNGTLGLNLIDDNTIVDANSAPLVGVGTADGSFTGDVYTVSTPFAWDGGGSDGNWSTAANWVDDVLPPAGSALYFAGTPSENGCCDDRTGVAFQSIEFASSGFSITAATALTLTGGITVDAGVGDATISMNVTADSPITVDVTDADAQLTIDTLSGSGSLTKSGGGTLALADDAHGGDTTVSAGTLLVGSLPSIFAEALQSGVTFNSALSSAAAVGDPDDSGGSFALNVPGLTGGSLSLGSDGILNWTPATGCQAATYPATVTYAYSGGHQVRAFPLNIETAAMPPVFDLKYSLTSDSSQLWHFETPCSVNDVYIEPAPCYWLVSRSFAARGGQGTLIYSLSGNPPPGAAIDSNGNFTCNLALADGRTVYDFCITVTDSAGQFDRVHVLGDQGFAEFAPDYPDSAPSNSPWLVATDSTDTRLAPLPWYQSVLESPSWYDPVLTIDTSNGSLADDGSDPNATISTPHGTLSFDPSVDYRNGYLLYTPAPGFHGLDSFTYDWTYNLYDDFGHLVTRLTTNTATYAIQVGNWVDLMPETSFENDPHQGIMGVGDHQTTTLTLQNPRPDGVPSTGYWSLQFDRSKIRVYNSDGQEIVPDGGGGWGGPIGSRFIETIPGCSSKAVTLTVVGVGAGTTDVEAHWSTWACHNIGVQPGQPGWVWATSQDVTYTVVGVDIVDLGRGKLITGLTSTVIVGQVNYLSGDVEPYGLEITSNQWTIPGDDNTLIHDYTQSTSEGTVYPLSPGYLQSQDVQFYWVASGTSLLVTYAATIDGHVYSAHTTFNVLRPTATLRSKTTTDTPAVAVDQPDGDGWILHFGTPYTSDDPEVSHPGITWNAQVSATADNAGQVAFVQLVQTDVRYTMDNVGQSKYVVSSGTEFVLDINAQQGTPMYRDHFFDVGGTGDLGSASESDSPWIRLPSSLLALRRSDVFETYLMYKSNQPGSIWVTLCDLEWYWYGDAKKGSDGKWSLVGAGQYLPDPPGFDSTHLPQWDHNVLQLAPVPDDAP